MLSAFRTDFYDCLTARADALFEVTDALLCTDGPVKSLVDLVLAPEHRRGHRALYDALSSGRVDVERVRRVMAGLPVPRAADGVGKDTVAKIWADHNLKLWQVTTFKISND